MQNTVLTEGDIVRVPMPGRPAVATAEEGEGSAAVAGSSSSGDVIMDEAEVVEEEATGGSGSKGHPLVYELLVSQLRSW